LYKFVDFDLKISRVKTVAFLVDAKAILSQRVE